MPCKIDIRATIENQVENLVASAYNKNINTARSIVKSVNDKFGHTVAKVVQRTPDQFDVAVNIPTIVIDKYFDAQKEMEIDQAREAQQQDAERAGEEYDDGYMFQLERNSSTPDVYNKLISFLKKYGFEINESENLVINLANKTIDLNTSDINQVAIAMAEPLSEMLSYSEYFYDVERAVRNTDRYKKRYRELEALYENSDKRNIKRLVTKEFFKEYLERGFTRSINNKLGVGKSIMDKINQFVKDLINLMKGIDVFQIEKRINEIVDNTFKGDDFIRVTKKEGYKKVDFQEAFDENSIAKDIMTKIGTHPSIILTGSIAYSTQGTVYRKIDTVVHDLDFVNLTLSEQELQDMVLRHYPDSIKAYSFFSGYQVDTFLVPPKGYVIRNIERRNSDTGKITSYQIVDNKGQVVGTYKLEYEVNSRGRVINEQEIKTGVEAMLVDFFSKDEQQREVIEHPFQGTDGKTHTVKLSHFREPFEAKLTYSRFKDIWDYNRFIPNSLEENVASEESSPQESKVSPETVSKIKQVLDKMGVSIQSISEYVKNHPGINLKGVNAIADSVNKIIAIAEGKEAGAITEEMVHIATFIINEKDPNLITTLISKIGQFDIYRQTLEEYKDNPFYKTADGKPNIRLIKKEAVDRLIAEIIVANEQGTPLDPSLISPTEELMVKNWWIKILDWFKSFYQKSDIQLFEEVAESIMDGSAIDATTEITDASLMAQLSDVQKTIQQNIIDTRDNRVRKQVEQTPQKVNPLMNDEKEPDNYYEAKDENGEWQRVKKRVTDRVKAYYDKLFPNKKFSEKDEIMNELKRTLGIEGHEQFENIHARYFDVQTGEIREVPLPRPTFKDSVHDSMYTKLDEYFIDLIDKVTEGGTKNVLMFSEAIVYDSKQKEAGTIDLLIIDENGKTHIIDWKFMDAVGDDVAWYKKGAFDIQLKRYKEILRTNYGVKEFGMNRAIPILFQFKKEKQWVADSGFVLSGIKIGNIKSEGIQDLKLVPVSEREEATGEENLDRFIKKLYSIMEQIAQTKVTTEEDSDYKNERLNIIERAIRVIRGKNDLIPAIEIIQILRREGDNLLNEYSQEFEGKDARDFENDDLRISEFAEDMRQYLATANALADVDSLLEKLIYTKEMEHNDMTAEEVDEITHRKEILSQFVQEVSAIRQSRHQIQTVANNFGDKFIGQKNQVTGLLRPEAIVQGLSATFRGVSELGTAALRILYKVTTNAKAMAAREATGEVDKLLEIRKRIVTKTTNVREYIKKIYQKDDDGKFVNRLIRRYSKEFYDGVKENAQEGNQSREWIMQNVDVNAYNEEATKVLNKKITRYRHRYGENTELVERLIESELNKWDFSRPTFNGWNNYLIYRFPLEKWESVEYKEIKADKDLFDLYNFISEQNEKAAEMGYITNQQRSSFLPFVRKSMAESLSWDMDISAVANLAGHFKVRPDDVGYGEINPVTGDVEYSIPKYYTSDFSRQQDGTIDNSEVSEDLFKNLILYINHSTRYKYLVEIEGQIKLVKTIETFKNHYKTGRFGDLILEGGEAVEQAGNYTNAKIFDDFQRSLLYGHKEVLTQGDTPLGIGKVTNYIRKAINNVMGRPHVDDTDSVGSLVKTMDILNKVFQIKTLGGEFIAGAAASFGSNIQLLAQSGKYFGRREVIANELRMFNNDFEAQGETTKMGRMFDLFMPLKDDPSYDRLLEAGLTVGTRHNWSDYMFVFMRKPELMLERGVFITLLQNMMMVDGRFVSIPQYVRDKNKGRYKDSNQLRNIEKKMEQEIAELKRTKSVYNTSTLDADGNLVIPGLDTSNLKEIQRLTNLTRKLSRDATGNLSDGDVNRMSMNIWTRSMMVFKNWIPKLSDTRFSEFRKTSDSFNTQIDENGMSIGDTYDIGNLRMFGIIMGMAIRDRAMHISNILQGNEAGIKALAEMYEEFADKYKKRTGEELNMSVEDFNDMVRMNLRNQVQELMLLLLLFGGALSMGLVAPDDDDSLANKNFFNFSERVVDKFIGELSFFYNPLEFQRMLSGSAFPAIGLFSDIQKFTNHFFMETSGIDLSNPKLTPEEVRKKAQPIKNAARMFPITKSMVTYIALFDSEFAKEFNIRVQNTNLK